jgi:hypothetical protein
MLRARLEEPLDVAAGGKVLARAGDDDDADAVVLVEGFEDEAKLVAIIETTL